MWSEDRFQEYQPIRAKRLLKEGKEREFRVNNHTQWVARVYNVAGLFQNTFNKYYNGEVVGGSDSDRGNSSNNDNTNNSNNSTNSTNTHENAVKMIKQSTCDATVLELRILLTNNYRYMVVVG